jgi:sensor domain CHASE-containing protein
MEDFMDGYVWEIVLVLCVYVISFFVYYRKETKLKEEIKNKLTDDLSIMEHQVLTRLINKSRRVK